MTPAVAERYIRHHVHYHPDQLFLPGFKMIEDRASVVAQAQANAETAGEGDQPKQNEVADVSVKDIAWSWVHDANRCFKQFREKLPPESMTAQQIQDTLRVVKSVRDAIYAYEKRLVALTGGQI